MWLAVSSDRGVQYASEIYRRTLKSAGAIASISRKGCCYDNAKVESFWSTLKLELVYRYHFNTARDSERDLRLHRDLL